MEYEILDFENLNPESLDGALVRQSNDLIEAKYQLPSLQEQRIILMLLAQIKPSDEDFKGYRISVTDFAKVVGIRGDVIYSQMDRITLSLRNRSISIRNGKDFFHTGWLSSAQYKHGSGYVELCFDPKLKPYLLQLKNHFTQYQLNNVLHFKSVYSIRLYELIKKEAWKAKNKELKLAISYEELREKFDINKKEYTKFNDFKRKTIEPAVLEIYEKSDLNIHNVEYKKTGRAVSHIVFSVQVRSDDETSVQQAQSTIDTQPKPLETHPVIESLVDMGFIWENAKSYKNKYGIKRIERNIAYVKAEIKAGTTIDRVPAYLSTAIKEDWGKATTSQKEQQQTKQAKELEEKAKKERAEEEEKVKIREQIKKNIFAFFILPEGLKTNIQAEFLIILKSEKKYANALLKWEVLKNEKELLVNEPILNSAFSRFLLEKKYIQ